MVSLTPLSLDIQEYQFLYPCCENGHTVPARGEEVCIEGGPFWRLLPFIGSLYSYHSSMGHCVCVCLALLERKTYWFVYQYNIIIIVNGLWLIVCDDGYVLLYRRDILCLPLCLLCYYSKSSLL